MNSEVRKNPIPCNIITGFLGVGKTTAILQLMTQKPANERWAVLVNEFGEVGIDSNLFAGSPEGQGDVTISQVPGGCMCCTNGLPMQMALNLLLARSKPHRLLIEPTGLGHPKEVLATLSGEYYRDVLNLQATLTLVDARKISDSRYTSHVTFNQQLEIAEIIVANKADLYQPEDFPRLLEYVEDRFGMDSKLVYQVQNGALELAWLTQPVSEENKNAFSKVTTDHSASALPASLETPAEGYICADNSGEGFFSRGWIFNIDWQFDAEKLHFLIQGIDAERVKGVFLTADGFVGFNKVDDVVSRIGLEIDSETNPDSRIEVISSRSEVLDDIEKALLQCLTHQETPARQA